MNDVISLGGEGGVKDFAYDTTKAFCAKKRDINYGEPLNLTINITS